MRPRLDQVVMVGHSVGGVMSAQLAADAAGEGLPAPKAVFAVQPGQEDEESMRLVRGVPPSTLVLVLAADRDTTVGDDGPMTLWGALRHIPAANRDYLLVRSDDHGSPPLLANHLYPLSGAGDPPDALDWFGAWKPLDALQGCALTRQDCHAALGGGQQQRYMGVWSDGQAVTPIQVIDG